MVLKKTYHGLISFMLRLAGLDFNWYKIFYIRVIYAIPFVEPFLQLIRSRSRAKLPFGPESVPHLKPGGVVLDIGANVGSISSLFLTLGLTVHAYEPDSRCIAMLKRRFKWVKKDRIFIHHNAISNQNEKVTLNYGSTTTESNSILKNKPGADGSTGLESVTAISIQDVIDQLGYVSLIKMDIEGAEYDVLDILLKPENIHKFGICLVEVHAKKIPGLMARQKILEEHIKNMRLTNRIMLTWH